MATERNKYGLSREIPLPKKRIIRQKSGFGCVVCGSAIYDYEHVDPPFEDATDHDVDRITLLCGGCHSYVTRGMWSKDKIKAAMENPKCLEKGFSFGAFDIGNNSPVVVLGTVTWVDTPVIIKAPDETLLRIDSPENIGEPFRLSGIFYDAEGQEIFRIEQNEWQGPINNWDIEIEGRTITIRRALRQILLKIRTEPPNRLVVEQLDMYYKGFRISGREGQSTRVIARNGSTVHSFSPDVNKKIIESLQNFSDEFRQTVLKKYESDNLPGVTLAECEAGIIFQEDGEVIFGKGCKMNPGGGGILITF